MSEPLIATIVSMFLLQIRQDDRLSGMERNQQHLVPAVEWKEATVYRKAEAFQGQGNGTE